MEVKIFYSMNPQLQQALAILKKKKEELMGQVNPVSNPQTMDMAMRMVMGGMAVPKTSLANPALYGQRDLIGRTLTPKNLEYIREGVVRGGNTMSDWASLSKIADLIEKGKDTPSHLRDAAEILKMIGLMK